MKATVIIAVYDRADFLPVVLKSLEVQKFKDFDVIVAEDGNSPEIASVVEGYQDKGPYSLRHMVQDDIGFRKNKIVNKAINASSSEYIVFIDGDCVLHAQYLAQYMRQAEKGLCLFGRRVMVDKKTTDALVKDIDLGRLSLWRIFLSSSKKKEEAIYLPFLSPRPKQGVFGCSFCVNREDIEAINGFDEDYTDPYYGEDTDIERRLILNGVKTCSTKFTTIQYHLYHDAGDRQSAWDKSFELYEAKSKMAVAYCENGLVKTGKVPRALAALTSTGK